MKTINLIIDGGKAEAVLIPVKSSNIAQVGYLINRGTNLEGKIHLVIEFFSGTYLYRDFPYEKYTNLLKAESAGTYFNTEIRGKYAFEKIG